jgi:uncharacterized protein
MSDVVGGKLLNEIKNIDLFITEACNMDCEYCFHQKGTDVLTIDQGKKIIDRMKELSPKELKITFFGGEPFLFPETVLELSKYALSKYEKGACSLHVVTNATYFDEKIFKALRELPFSIQVSIDGDEVTTKEHRGGDFNLVVENIKKIREIFHEVSARMTFTPKTVGRLSINVQFVHQQLGISKIMYHAVMEADWKEEDILKYQQQLNHLYHYRRFCYRNQIPIDIVFIDKPLKILNDEIPSETNFCEAGKSYIAILSNGDVYPCHRAASNRLFKLGNIFEEIPFIRGIFLNIDKSYLGCSKMCEASLTCHSCIITHYKVNGELTKPISQYCKLCQVENQQAKMYLNTEVSDRHEMMLKKLAAVVVGNSDQIEKIVDYLDKINLLEKVKNETK